MGDRGLGATLVILAAAVAAVYFADAAILREKVQEQDQASSDDPMTWPIAGTFNAVIAYVDVLVVWLTIFLLDTGIPERFVVPYLATIAFLYWCLVAWVWRNGELDVIDRKAERELVQLRLSEERRIAAGDPPSGIPLGSPKEFRAWFVEHKDWRGRSWKNRRRDTTVGLVLAGIVLCGVLIATVPAVAGW